MINDILDISKFESGKMELDKQKFNLRLSIENLIEILWFKANEKNLDIYYYISPEIPEVIVTDSHKLLRIIMNLISNSIKFTETGYIKLDIKLIYKDEKICNISFSVKDTGIGIPDDKKEKLFKPFTQVDSSITNKFGGTGLGLTISKNIVDLMDGEISFQNNKDLEGTTFNFNIKVPYINHYEQLPKKTFLSNKKVFIYSDNLEFIELVTKYSNDVNLIVFSSINDDILKTNFDVLILDTDKKYLDSNISVPIVSYSKNNTQKIGSYNLHIPLKTYDFYNIIYQAINNIKVNEKENDNHNTNKFLKPREKIKNLRILVAEDNLVNQKLIQKVFDKLGYKIDLVNNGLEAVQICKEKEYDLILMDVQMPEMDGIEATKQIRLNLLDKTPKIVALTANVLQEQKDECLKVGMSDFLTKPFKISDIQNLVLTISNK
ncbi:MAG: response regulator [Candidatus Sericytochromatia bacterium]